MDPMLFSLLVAWWLVHAAKEVPYAVRGKTSPRMQRKVAQAQARAAQAQAKVSMPVRQPGPARQFFAALWRDAWVSAHRTRRRTSARRRAGTLWYQQLGRQVHQRWQARHGDQPQPTWMHAERPDTGPRTASASTGRGPTANEVVDGEVVPTPPAANRPPCDGKCLNSGLGPDQALAKGWCPQCGGLGELISNFGGEHRHITCVECQGSGCDTPSRRQSTVSAARTESCPQCAALRPIPGGCKQCGGTGESIKDGDGEHVHLLCSTCWGTGNDRTISRRYRNGRCVYCGHDRDHHYSELPHGCDCCTSARQRAEHEAAVIAAAAGPTTNTATSPDSKPVEEPVTTTTAPQNAEAVSLSQALEYTHGMAGAAAQAASHAETFQQSLLAREVAGRPVQLTGEAIELLANVHAKFTELTEALRRHQVVGDAYASVGNEAGSKTFNTAG